MNERRNDHLLLHVRDIPPNAAPGSRTKGNKRRVQVFHVVIEPSLWLERRWVREDLWVSLEAVRRAENLRVAWDPMV